MNAINSSAFSFVLKGLWACRGRRVCWPCLW